MANIENQKNLFVKDKRDQPFLNQMLLTSFTIVPFALCIFFLLPPSPWISLIYWVTIIYFLGPHLLMLHNVCHRSPWKKPFKKFFDYSLEVQGLFFGLPPSIYYHHHIKMHHKEGNGPRDLSSTEPFARDSFIGWLNYFLRFIFICPVELPLYFLKTGRKDFALKVSLGYIFFYCFMISAFYVNSSAAITVFLVPTLICWFGLMGGNWAQHAFIDTNSPENPFKNSITVIDSVYNKRCFNDGYHIGHHLSPGMHWSEMPGDFEKNIDIYYENDAMVFRKLDYQIIWFLLMLKQYKFLAKFYVPHNERLDIDQIMTKIKSKLGPVQA